MKNYKLVRKIMVRTVIYGIGLGALMGLVFQTIFFQIDWDTIFWGAGFGALGGLIVGLINGAVASVIFLNRFSKISDIRKYRLTINGFLLLATVLATLFIYMVVFYLISGNLITAFIFAVPIIFLSSICSLIGSHFLGKWYMNYLTVSK